MVLSCAAASVMLPACCFQSLASGLSVEDHARSSRWLINPFPGLVSLWRLGIDGRTTWPVALKKDYRTPQMLLVYANCMCLRSISGAKKSGVALYVSALRLLPWNQTLSGLTPNTGGTKVRDHPKAVGSCASAAMVGISYRVGTYTTCF